MNNKDNPYFTLAQLIKQPTQIQNVILGKVTSISPLLVNANGIQLDKKDLLINKDLLKCTKRNIKLDGTRREIENIEDNFKVGSTVVLLTQDNQKFYLICEVI